MKIHVKIIVLAFVISLMIPMANDASEKISTSTTHDSDNSNPQNVYLVLHQGLSKVLDFVNHHPLLFSSKRDHSSLLNIEQKNEILNTWKVFLDYEYALDDVRKAAHQQNQFYAEYSAFLAEYRFALDWIDKLDENSELDVLLNEPSINGDMKAGSFSDLKFRFLNVARATEFVAFETMRTARNDQPPMSIREFMDNDRSAIWAMGQGKGHVYTLKNAMKIIQGTGEAAWFPVQTGVATWMGDVRVLKGHHFSISDQQIEQLKGKLQPGDIFLERREWYLSNMGLPGFWTHVALYVGTAEVREQYFNDSSVLTWLSDQHSSSATFESTLKQKFPQQYEISQKNLQEGPARVIEAISEGVSFTALEHSAASDSLAILRPRLSKVEKAIAIQRAFSYVGRPYDFNFDFSSDASLVCSEVVYKSYQSASTFKGLRLPLESILGRPLTTPNQIALVYEEESPGPNAQFDLVEFLDNQEAKGVAIEASIDEFKKSAHRPKWHVFVQ